MIRYNDDRDEEALLALRPLVPVAIHDDEKWIEQFQNASLRPILKFQHNVLLDFLCDQPNFDAVLKYKEKRSVFSERIRIFLQQPILKGVCIGMVVGHLSREEMRTYNKQKKEFNNRIIQMLIERFTDALS